MQNTEWRPIKGYEDLYLVSNTGLIKSLHWGKEKILKQVIKANLEAQKYFDMLMEETNAKN